MLQPSPAETENDGGCNGGSGGNSGGDGGSGGNGWDGGETEARAAGVEDAGAEESSRSKATAPQLQRVRGWAALLNR